MKQHITMFDREYPKDKQAEGIAISEAVAFGHCNKCGALKQCSKDVNFQFPVFAWCQQRKSQILKAWLQQPAEEE